MIPSILVKIAQKKKLLSSTQEFVLRIRLAQLNFAVFRLGVEIGL
jgi:hypothetical protein